MVIDRQGLFKAALNQGRVIGNLPAEMPKESIALQRRAEPGQGANNYFMKFHGSLLLEGCYLFKFFLDILILKSEFNLSVTTASATAESVHLQKPQTVQ